MQKEVNLLPIIGIVLLVILLIVAAVTLTQCGGEEPQPTEPSVATDPTEEETQPTETEEPTEPPHVHEWEETVTEPDCISEGYTTGVCACGESYVGDKIEALGHSWKDATCTEPKTCTACGVTEDRAKGHTWDEGKVTKEPVEGWEGKPGEDGEMLYTCTVCGATKTVVIPSPDHEHDYTHREEVTPATCTKDGFTAHYCRCEDSVVDSNVPATGHTMKKGNCVTPDACAVCGTILNPAPGHDWKDATCTEPMTCHCGATTGIPKGHKEQIVKGKEPTCTETGLTDGKKCSVCGEILFEQEVIPAKGHTETTVKGKEPTCTETGLTDGVQCSVSTCKTWIKAQEVIPALGHKEETVKGYDPTCTKDGLTDGIQCSVCKTWIDPRDPITAPGHKEVTVKGKEATCTETGLTDGTQCSVCQTWIKKQETIALKEHAKTSVKGYAATCTVDGRTDGVQCSVCKKWLDERDIIPAPGHQEVTVEGNDATCTSGGYADGVECSVCYQTIVYQQYIEELGHDFPEWVVETEATCGADGKQIRTCSRCPETEEQTIKATGNHTYDKCVCTVCGDVFEGTPDLKYRLSDDATYYICTGISDYTPPKHLVIPAYHNGKPVKRIASYAFTGASFKKITFPETLEYIGGSAFYHDDDLDEITIPNSVTYIGTRAFGNCDLDKAYIYTTGWKCDGEDIDLSDPYVAGTLLSESGEFTR